MSAKRHPAETIDTDDATVIATIERDKPVATVVKADDSATIMSIIQQVATNPDADIDKMQRLMQMHERYQAGQAKQAFDKAMSKMQKAMPIIRERGAIRDKYKNVQSTYALWEDINEDLKPVLAKFGFALTFRIPRCERGVEVEGVLSHEGGHRESTSILLPVDATGSKNGVQAVASSVSYGKRYTAGALLNFTTTGEDDDGQAAGATDPPSPKDPPPEQLPPPYPKEKLDENLQSWRKAFVEKRSSPQHVISMISSRNTLSPKQIETINQLMPAEGETA